MNTSILQREAIAREAAVPDSSDVYAGWSEELADTLGYRVLSAQQESARQLAHLHETLAELEIAPFTNESVKAYKDACEEEAFTTLDNIIDSSFILGLFAAVGAFPVLIVAALFSMGELAFYAAAVLSVGMVIAIACYNLGGHYFLEKKWQMHALEAYPEPVPEFALQTAMDVKNRCPDVEFYISTLVEAEVIIDPFLVLRFHDGERDRDYYLEVWNESTCQGEREV